MKMIQFDTAASMNSLALLPYLCLELLKKCRRVCDKSLGQTASASRKRRHTSFGLTSGHVSYV